MARHIQNFMGTEDISGPSLINKGLKQAKLYGTEALAGTVTKVFFEKNKFFVESSKGNFETRNLIVASGINDILPEIDNVGEFMGETFFTCFDCDGYHLTDKKVCIIGEGDGSARTALAVRQTYSKDVTLCVQKRNDISDEYLKKLEDQNIKIVQKKITHLIGTEGKLEKVEFEDGSKSPFDCVLSDLGYTRNDSFLSSLDLEKSERGYYKVDEHYESSQKGLFIIGPLNTGPDQVSVAVGQGAISAMHIIETEFKF